MYTDYILYAARIAIIFSWMKCMPGNSNHTCPPLSVFVTRAGICILHLFIIFGRTYLPDTCKFRTDATCHYRTCFSFVAVLFSLNRNVPIIFRPKITSSRVTVSCSDNITNLRRRDKALNTRSQLAVMSPLLQPQTTRMLKV